jgi:hypothetical protein
MYPSESQFTMDGNGRWTAGAGDPEIELMSEFIFSACREWN